MAKPNFAAAKKPTGLTAEQAAFIEGGRGKDKSSKAKALAKGQETHRLSIDVPMDLFLRFKVGCVRSRTKMAPEILEFIEQRTAEMEQEKGTRPLYKPGYRAPR